MASSLVHRALHPFRHTHFSGAHCRRQKHNINEDNASQRALEADLHSLLAKLHIQEQNFLTLPWLHDAVKLALLTCTGISNVSPKISCTDKEKNLLEANLEDSLMLLDVCNGLKEALNDVQHYVMLVQYAAHSSVDLKDAPENQFKSKLAHLRGTLIKSEDFMQARVEENKRCSRMSKPLPGKCAASNALFNDLVFVCGVLAITLSFKPKESLTILQMRDQPGGLTSLKSLQQNVKNATDGGLSSGKATLLKELDEVHTHASTLCKLTVSLDHGVMPSDVDRLNLSGQCEMLVSDSEKLQKGLYELQQHIDSLFRVLITIRVDFLDALCHA